MARERQATNSACTDEKDDAARKRREARGKAERDEEMRETFKKLNIACEGTTEAQIAAIEKRRASILAELVKGEFTEAQGVYMTETLVGRSLVEAVTSLALDQLWQLHLLVKESDQD